MTPSTYLDALHGRLAADGCNPQLLDWGGRPVLVGRRADFRLRWAATRLHLFVIAAEVPHVTADGMSEFTHAAMAFARANKGGLPLGFQNGLGVFPTLIGEHVQPDAATWVASGQVNSFGCMARPATVDTTTGVVSQFRGTTVLGGLYSGHLRRKGVQYFPDAPDTARAPAT